MKTLRLSLIIFSIGLFVLSCKKEKEEPNTNVNTENPATPIVNNGQTLFVETGSLDSLSPTTPIPISVKAVFENLPDNWEQSYEIVFERSINNQPFTKVPSNLVGSIYKSGDTLITSESSLFTTNSEANFRFRIYGIHHLDNSSSTKTETKEVTFNTSNSWLILTSLKNIAPRYLYLFLPQISGYPDVYIFTSGHDGNTATFNAQKAKLLPLDSIAFQNITSAEQLINLTQDTTGLQNYHAVKAGDCIMFSTPLIGQADYPTRRVRKAIAYIKKAYTFDSGYQAYCLMDIKYLY